MDRRIGWPTSIVALGFLALVGLMFWRATDNMAYFDKVWSVAGPILGVVVGAIPGFFFAQSARRDQKDASQRAEAYAAALPDDHRPDAMQMLKEIRAGGQP
jgi:hypothetical protein